jgi:hypothetical protein
MHSQLRIDIKQNVNVAGHDLARKQETVRFLANLTDNLLEPLINASNQDRASVFRAKNHVVLARKNNVPIRSITHRGLDDITGITVKSNALSSPCLKAGVPRVFR